MRTWDENRQAINQLWPLMTFTDEEKRLWHDDLNGLDQDVLYNAIRNVKRNNDSNYPHLKWVRDEYRCLARLANVSASRAAVAGEQVEPVRIDDEQDASIGKELRWLIESASQAEHREMVDLIAEKAGRCQIRMATAFSLVRYLRQRLGLDTNLTFGASS